MIINGNALHLPLADESIQCVVTSPPYFGLRDYGTAKWVGGDPECDHKQATARNDGGRSQVNGFHGSTATNSDKGPMNYRDVCPHCGARRIDAQLGLEPTPEEYVANMVAVFREVRRVLREDGTLWLNLGDSYSSKQLVGIPWRLAFALQADGWWLRSDVIWHKPNPMPESVKDRPTRSHEHLFLLTKSSRYFYDATAIAEPAQPFHKCGPNSRANVDRTVEHGTRKQDAIGKGAYTGFNERYRESPVATRNRRDVWTIATRPYSGAHFATMPPDLVEPCVRAGTSERGCCPKCGAPWERVTERRPYVPAGEYSGKSSHNDGQFSSRRMDLNKRAARAAIGDMGADNPFPPRVTAGWRPTCDCDAGEPVPCVTLDPFAGAGTVGLVASRLGRRHIGVELSLEYCRMAERRIYQDAPL